ncbi:hypothetical protein BCR39DRAFT_526047 [Naematelia encephala]|uniref:Mediator of RNA polymerase II transcription subunit 13 n=1 Tax=Naematelia encephala TaxID=71784 RepID=A0A1Y2BA44_9TREE|nr:hypothetical protein BCR39DRAFT_526047 [Naematelia encephala]
MRRDWLGHQPAKSSTTVPGHWLLDLPRSSDGIQVRRFRSVAESSQAGPSSDTATILQRLREDTLEKTWRLVNERGSHSDIRGALSTGCAVICVEDGERILWSFSAGTHMNEDENYSALQELEGLQEVLPRLSPIEPAKLVKCSKHGHSVSCLASPRPDGIAGPIPQPCDIRWTNSDVVKRSWEKLGHAIVEKLAWNNGQRIWMGDHDHFWSPAKATLLPMASPSLLLRIEQQPVPRCRAVPSDKKPSLHQLPFILFPLSAPALCLGPQDLSKVQIARQSALFDKSLGLGWKHGRAERRTAAQLAEESWSDWSVYWIPTSPFRISEIADTTAAQLAQTWQEGKGVVTIWPTHLAHDLSAAPLSASHKRNPVPIIDLPTPSGAMDVAVDVFELMANYREPAVEENTPGAEEIVISDGDNDGPAHRSFFDRPPQSSLTSRANGDSDLDDLFSTHSSSPEANEPIAIESDQASEDDLFGEPEEDAAVPDLKVEEERTGLADDDDPPPGLVMADDFDGLFDDDELEDSKVTEDDFDFFDSPAAEKNSLPTITEEVVPDDMVPQKVTTPPSSPPVQPDLVDLLEGQPPPPTDSEGPIAAEDPPNPQAVHASPIEIVVDDTPVIATHQTPLHTSSDRPGKRKRPVFEADIVPSDFEALPLHSASTSLASQIYALPSPAPTPESIRPDLVERLKLPSQPGAFDYAKDWIMEADQSETEEEEWSGAPPTPESEVDDTESTSGRPTPAVPADARRGGEVEYGSIVCVGPELAILVEDEAGRAAVERPWPLNKMTPESPVSLVGPSPMIDAEHIDLDRLCLEIIYNSQFRQSLLTSQIRSGSIDVESLGSLITSGDVLNDVASLPDTHLLDPDDKFGVGPLATCKVHAGYHGNVMQLDISGLHYWQEIGLQPVGGRKDLQILVVSTNASAKVYAMEFLERMHEIYGRLRLGSMVPSQETPGAFISASEKDLPEVLTKAVTSAKENTVVFVLSDLPVKSMSTTRTLKAARETVITHYLTLSDIEPSRLENTAFDVFNRMPRLLQQKDVHISSDSNRSYMQYPSFTIAPDHPPRPALTLAWPLRSYDVFNKWRLVHGGYIVTLDTMIAFVIDAEGENFQVKSWKVREKGWKQRLEVLWVFLAGFARVAAVEWRLSISALGGMTDEEQEAWSSLLASKKAPVTVLVAEVSLEHENPADRSRVLATNVPVALLADPSSTLIDETLIGHALPCHHRIPLGSSSTYPRTTFILSLATPRGANNTALYHVLHHRPAPGKEDEEVDKLFAREFYRLACLARVRFRMNDGCLPVHLESIRLISAALDIVTTSESP